MAHLILHDRGPDPLVEVVCCPECDEPARLLAWSALEQIAYLECAACSLQFTRDTRNYTKEVRQCGSET